MERPVRKSNRLREYDYSQPGCYFVTICTKDRQPLFWTEGVPNTGVGAACGRPPLSKIGTEVEEEVKRLSHTYPMVSVDKFAILPNHIHLMVRIDPPKNGRPQAAPTLQRIINQFKGSVTKRAGILIWQKGYHDHVVRSDADYLRIWDYIDTNPAKWREDRYYGPEEE